MPDKPKMTFLGISNGSSKSIWVLDMIHQDEGFSEPRLLASQPLLKVVVGCFVLLYWNTVCLVLGCFYLFISFVLMLFDVKSTNHLIFPPQKKVVSPPLWRSQWIYQKFWVNRFLLLSQNMDYSIFQSYGKRFWVLGGFLFFSFVKQHPRYPRWGVWTVLNE